MFFMLEARHFIQRAVAKGDIHFSRHKLSKRLRVGLCSRIVRKKEKYVCFGHVKSWYEYLGNGLQCSRYLTFQSLVIKTQLLPYTRWCDVTLICSFASPLRHEFWIGKKKNKQTERKLICVCAFLPKVNNFKTDKSRCHCKYNVVVINNNNPYLVHTPHTLATHAERFTITFWKGKNSLKGLNFNTKWRKTPKGIHRSIVWRRQWERKVC